MPDNYRNMPRYCFQIVNKLTIIDFDRFSPMYLKHFRWSAFHGDDGNGFSFPIHNFFESPFVFLFFCSLFSSQCYFLQLCQYRVRNANTIQDFHRQRQKFPPPVCLHKHTYISSLENECSIIRKCCFGPLSLDYINN